MPEDLPKIRIFASDDNLKSLGELLSNETSRKIITNLMEHQMYTNEIATKLDIRVSLVIHHLRKLEELGLLVIEDKKIKRKGEDHRFFKMDSDIFITLNTNKEEIKEKGILQKIFREGIKFTSVGLIGMLVWMTDITHFYKTDNDVYPGPFGINSGELDPIIPALIVIIICMIIERGFSIWKNKKRG